jgi:hypothetical protein
MEALTSREDLAQKFLETARLAAAAGRMLRIELGKPKTTRDLPLIVSLTETLTVCNEALASLTRALEVIDAIEARGSREPEETRPPAGVGRSSADLASAIVPQYEAAMAAANAGSTAGAGQGARVFSNEQPAIATVEASE